MDLDYSAIVPAHNAEPFLAETLAALDLQTVRPREVIVVDDGSSDATGDIAREFAFSDGSRPVVVVNDRALGVAAARNRGLAASRGSWIGFCDSDDLWHARRIEKTLALASARPDARAIATGVVGFALEEDRTVLTPHPRLGMVSQWVPAAGVLDLVTRGVPDDGTYDEIGLAELQDDIVFATTSVSYRRDALAEAGGCAAWSHLADDYMLNVSVVAGGGSILHLRGRYVNYRVRASSLSHAGADIALPYLAANVAARHGVERPSVGHAGRLYQHMVLERARSGASAREVAGFALLGGSGWVPLTKALVKARVRRAVRRFR
jgi:glycosyltransferase involved in cell wall biosynthesis